MTGARLPLASRIMAVQYRLYDRMRHRGPSRPQVSRGQRLTSGPSGARASAW